MPALTPRPVRASRLLLWVRGAAVAAIIAAPLAQVYAQNAPAAAPGAASALPQAGFNYLDKQEERQFNLYHGLLKQKDADPENRVQAAAALMDTGWAIAIGTLAFELEQNGDVGTQRAIAQAIAVVDTPSTRFTRPLVKLLTTENVELRRDVAAALGRYEDEKLIKQLIQLATETRSTEAQRRGAVRALGEHRKAAVIQTLLKLAETPDAALRSLAFESLARLTGIKDYREDLELWHAWWQRAQKLDEPRFLAMLLRNVAARNSDANKDLQSLTTRLVSTYDLLYNATADPARAAVLEKMLSDDVADVRLQALKLVERRLLNAQSIDETVRGAMRIVLDDEHPPVRVLAAKLLETVADVAGAQRVVLLLSEHLDEPVQQAYLELLARVPVEGAIDAALDRMANPALRGPALAVIVAAADAGKLMDDQADKALALVRRDLHDTEDPEPMALRLLGRRGDVNDEPHLANWLKHPDPDVKLAAAEALSADRWPLGTLLDYLGDATLGPIVTPIAGRRASQFSELVKLLDAEPIEVDRQRPWRDAAVAICTRLDTEGLLALAARMRSDEPHRSLYEAMLIAVSKVAIDPAKKDDAEFVARIESRLWEAHYLLAELYLDTARPALANDPLDRLMARRNISTADKRRLSLLQLSAMLHNIKTVEAEAHTAKLLTEVMGPSADTVAALWIEAIEHAASGHAEAIVAAKAMYQTASRLFNGKLGDETRQSMVSLAKTIAAAEIALAARVAAENAAGPVPDPGQGAAPVPGTVPAAGAPGTPGAPVPNAPLPGTGSVAVPGAAVTR